MILHGYTTFTELENEFDSCWNSLEHQQSFMALIFKNLNENFVDWDAKWNNEVTGLY